MCTRGVYQLRKLSIYFCDFGGSSQGIRDALVSPNFADFFSANPHITLDIIRKRNSHPFVTGAYLNGYLKDQVMQKLGGLRNQLGRRSFSASGPRAYHPVKSVQGKWMPNMFNTYPRAELERVPHIERQVPQEVEKEVRDYRGLKQKDAANILLDFDDVNARDHV